MKQIKTILFPGWAVPPEMYSHFNADMTIDYGFFGGKPCFEDILNPLEQLEALQPAKPYRIIAHSLGGLFALRTSQFRDNADAIILYGCFAKFAESDDNPDGQPQRQVEAMRKQLKRNPQILLKSFHRTMVKPAKINITVPDTLNADKLDEGLYLLQSCDIRGELHSVKPRVKILHGAEDSIVSPRLAEMLSEAIPDSELKIFNNSGHALPFENTNTYQ